MRNQENTGLIVITNTCVKNVIFVNDLMVFFKKRLANGLNRNKAT